MQDLAALKQQLLDYTDSETSLFFQSAIDKCCQRIERDNRLRRLPFEVTVTVQGSAMPDGYYTLPDDFAALEDFHFTYVDRVFSPKFRVRREFWKRLYPGEAALCPQLYTIENDAAGAARLVLSNTQPADLEYRITYSAKPTPLVNDTDTNWLLQNHEAVYLYGSLIELSPFRDEDYRAQTWAQFYDDAADELKKMIHDQQFPRGDIQRAPSALTVI